jgi:hypothetical protein
LLASRLAKRGSQREITRAANIQNSNTRRAYAFAAGEFIAFCQRAQLAALALILTETWEWTKVILIVYLKLAGK